MPWKEELPMDQKTQFISEYLRDSLSFTELCQRYHISRKTGYKWIARYQAEGPAGLVDRSRRPHSFPDQTPEVMRLAIIQARRRHPSWGAKKLLKLLQRRDPQTTWPSRWTVCVAHLARQRARRVEQRLGRDDAAHEPAGERLLGREHAARVAPIPWPRLMPTRRGRNQLLHASGTMPRRANTKPMRARAATRCGRPSAASSSTPTPTAGPLIAAITGFFDSKMRSVTQPAAVAMLRRCGSARRGSRTCRRRRRGRRRRRTRAPRR